MTRTFKKAFWFAGLLTLSFWLANPGALTSNRDGDSGNLPPASPAESRLYLAAAHNPNAPLPGADDSSN